MQSFTSLSGFVLVPEKDIVGSCSWIGEALQCSKNYTRCYMLKRRLQASKSFSKDLKNFASVLNSRSKLVLLSSKRD